MDVDTDRAARRELLKLWRVALPTGGMAFEAESSRLLAR